MLGILEKTSQQKAGTRLYIMNRIDKKFQELREQGTSVFMPYAYTEALKSEPTSDLFHALEETRVDFIESRRRCFLVTNAL